jgi:D-glycero-alpha-D-manno-heptose-7-phosphate kinase
MIISKTPLRLSFVGGGSDLPSYYRKARGAVLSTSIDKFVYVTINTRFEPGIRLSYSKTEIVERLDQIEHRLVKAALGKLDLTTGIEITSVADIPSRGSGLGSSSSFTVGLLHAIYAYIGRYRSKLELGADACEVEIVLCEEPIGKQDQYAAAVGGLNVIEFHADDTVSVQPVVSPPGTLQQVEREMLMFYTGSVRSASAILQQQAADVDASAAKRTALERMVELVYVLRGELSNGHADAVGPILHENWHLKRQLTGGITSPLIDETYEAAMRAGATGGKLLGAGGGGFVVFSVPVDRQPDVIASLAHLRHVPFRFENGGANIAFYQSGMPTTSTGA